MKEIIVIAIIYAITRAIISDIKERRNETH